MSPLQLRETTMAPQTRRLVQMTIDAHDSPDQMLDMLLARSAQATGASGSRPRAIWRASSAAAMR